MNNPHKILIRMDYLWFTNHIWLLFIPNPFFTCISLKDSYLIIYFNIIFGNVSMDFGLCYDIFILAEKAIIISSADTTLTLEQQYRSKLKRA